MYLVCNKALAISIFTLTCLITLSGAPASAFTKIEWDCHESQSNADCMKAGGLKSIFIYDEINSEDSRQLADIDSKYPIERPLPKLFITSRGGSMRAAIEIGRILRRRTASIEGRDLFFPDRPAHCDSACVSLAAGAVDRQFDQIGVHRPMVSSVNKDCKPTQRELTDTDLDEDRAYFNEMGMPPKLFEYLKNTPSARMTEFYYDPETLPEEQMIVQLGFRMHPTEPNAPKMFRPDGTPRFSSAVTLMERGVEVGNADAAYRLGTIYQDGSGDVRPDVNRAIKWFEKAGVLGTYAAYHHLGVMFGNGNGVNIDHKKAAEYYGKAAEVGFAGSQNNLGWSYYKGEGVAKNYGLAIYWITRSAEQGEPFAYSSLGEMRLYAHGFPADDIEAFKWLKLADVSLPKGRAQDDNMRLLKKLEKRMKAADIKKATALAEAWRPLKQTKEVMANKCKY